MFSPGYEVPTDNIDPLSDRIESLIFFLWRKGNRGTHNKLSGKDENQQQTQPTHVAMSRNRTRATLLGGECSHHCHHCSFTGIVVTKLYVTMLAAMFNQMLKVDITWF